MATIPVYASPPMWSTFRAGTGNRRSVPIICTAEQTSTGVWRSRTTAAAGIRIRLRLRACFGHVEPQAGRHGRTCSGHPCLARGTKDLDARDEPAHDGGETRAGYALIYDSIAAGRLTA